MKYFLLTFFVSVLVIVGAFDVAKAPHAFAIDEDEVKEICEKDPNSDDCKDAEEELEEQKKKAKEAEEKAEEIEEKIEKEQEKLQDHQTVLSGIQSQLTITTQQIRQVENTIQTTEETIQRKTAEIEQMEKKLFLQRALLKDLVQTFYTNAQTPLAVRTLQTEGFFQVVQARDGTLSLQERITDIVKDVHETKQKIHEEKASLENVKDEKESVLAIKRRQESQLAEQRSYQTTKVAKTEATIQSLQEKLSELQSDIARLTGKSYSTKDIREAVEFASDKTRVPKSVLYGFLGAETRFNANTGQCTYKQVEKDAIKLWYGTSSKWKGSRDLLKKRMDIFYDIVDDLGYSKDKKVSCTPRSYVGQGGAMGVSQFMSDVWRGYESQIRAKTGNKNPDPWSLVDGIMAMAIKLEKAGATSTDKGKVRSASESYLGALNQSYYKNILYWMENYEEAFK